MPLQVIHAFGVVKKCAAQYNMKHGKLDETTGQAMIAAADEVIAGHLDEHFPLVIFQTGSGTHVPCCKAVWRPIVTCLSEVCHLMAAACMQAAAGGTASMN